MMSVAAAAENRSNENVTTTFNTVRRARGEKSSRSSNAWHRNRRHQRSMAYRKRAGISAAA